ncbi:MAG: hypothetical protein GC154_21435 [bacterium]|nr:hypothetical protein [bacterium]
MNFNKAEHNHNKIQSLLFRTGVKVRERLLRSLREQSQDERAAVAAETREDTIFQIDRDVEDVILPVLEDGAAEAGGLVLIAEGIGEDEPLVFPAGTRAEDAAYRVIMDPIDGTRGIMYDKRSAFYLAGAAPNHAGAGRLRDIEAAVMVELPTSRHFLSDVFMAIRGQGARRVTHNILTGEVKDAAITPSASKTIYGGYGQISRFFPPGKDVLARIEEDVTRALFPYPPQGKAILFNDQYISTGGQMYEMLAGHDRFVADLRAALFSSWKGENEWRGLTCHPYDVCAYLICEEAGIPVTGANGEPLDAPMNVNGDVDWIAYANTAIRAEVEPVLMEVLRKHGLIG